MSHVRTIKKLHIGVPDSLQNLGESQYAVWRHGGVFAKDHHAYRHSQFFRPIFGTAILVFERYLCLASTIRFLHCVLRILVFQKVCEAICRRHAIDEFRVKNGESQTASTPIEEPHNRTRDIRYTAFRSEIIWTTPASALGPIHDGPR